MHTLALDFEQAKAKHLLFKTRLRAILYGADIDEAAVVSHTECGVGKWIYSHALKSYGHIPEMEQLHLVHIRLHELAAELVKKYKAGHIDEARKGLTHIELIADNLVSLLTVVETKIKQELNPSDNRINNELLQTNYEELLALNQLIRDLDLRISQQSEQLYATRSNVERQLTSHFSQAPVAICILRGDNFIVELANKLYLQLVDRKEDFIGRPLFDSLAELEGQGIREMLTGVMETGTPFVGNEIGILINRNGSREDAFFNFTYQPLREDDGKIGGIMVVCTEVTKEVLAKHKLRESERRLQIAIDSAELGTFELNVKTGKMVLSDRYLTIFGYKSQQENLKHADLLDKIHPEDREKRNFYMEEGLKTGILNYTMRVFDENGNIKWITAKGKVFYDSEGKPESLLGTIMDVTENTVNQERIANTNRTLEIAMEAATLGSFDLNLVTGQANFNDICKKNYGFPLDAEVTLDMVLSKVHPDDKNYMQNAMRTALENNTKYNAEYRILIDEETVNWISSSGRGVYDKDGIAVKLVGVNANVTKRKKAEEELSLSLEKFRLLADIMPQFVWTGNIAGNLDYFNQSVYTYSGLTHAQMQADGWLQMVHPDDRQENIQKWFDAITTGTDFIIEHRFRKHTGEYRWQLSRAIPQKNKDGVVQMWVGTSTDIHDQKMFSQEMEMLVHNRTKELKQANLDLENMNQELSSFAYISSHDLQEPLRKIQTFISRIKEMDAQNFSEKTSVYLDRVQNSASKMQTLINDLITYSRTSTKKEKFFEKTDLSLLIQEIKIEFSEVLTEKNGTLEISDMPVIKAIPFQLRQLFVNLISNAIKFSKKGVAPVIKISTQEIKGSEIPDKHAFESDTYYQIDIRDNGIGFDKEYSQRIFEVFQKLHGKHEYEGTGIGLSICKKIVQNHHGFIMVTSEPNAGTVFTIYIPANL